MVKSQRRLDGNGLLIAIDGKAGLLLLQINITEIVMNIRDSGIDGQGGSQEGQRSLPVAQRGEQSTQVVVRLERTRIDLDRLFEALDRAMKIT